MSLATISFSSSQVMSSGQVLSKAVRFLFFSSLIAFAFSVACLRIPSIFSGCSRQAFCLSLVRLSLRKTQPLRAVVRLGLVIAVDLRTR